MFFQFDINYLIIILNSIVIIYLILPKLFSNQSKNDSDTIVNQNEQVRFEECPPYYPNGWLPVLESMDLKTSQVKPIFAFGYDLIAFRGLSGKVYVLDAYCPHLGSHLGVGGVVIGENIKCPFHGWVFNNEGNCVDVPTIDSKNTPKAQIKVWDSLEVNGFIYVWNHSLGEKPNWSIEPIENNLLVYRGKCEQLVYCHIQDIIENNADLKHLIPVHGVPEFLSFPLQPGSFSECLHKYFNITLSSKWEPGREQHISNLSVHGTYNIGILKIKFHLETRIIGPATVEIMITLFNIKLQAIAAIISEGPRQQRLVHHYYSFYSERNNLISRLLSYYWPKFFNEQFLRDVRIWNNKKYLSKPYLSQNEAELKGFRRWYKQFYQDHTFENNTSKDD